MFSKQYLRDSFDGALSMQVCVCVLKLGLAICCCYGVDYRPGMHSCNLLIS